MSSLNNYAATGRLVKDWDLKHGKSGTAYASNALAVDTSYGEDKATLFLPLKAFGKPAENLKEYTGKGSALAIESRLQQENWEDKKDGSKRSRIVAVITKSVFLDSKEKQMRDEDDIPEGEIPF